MWVVLYNCNQADTIEFLKEVARLIGGRCRGEGVGCGNVRLCLGGCLYVGGDGCVLCVCGGGPMRL